MSDTTMLKDNLKGSVPGEVARELIKDVVTQSIAFQICRHVPMASDSKTLPVLTDTGSAYWTEESEAIQTSVMGFDYPTLKAKKLAVIVPTTKEKLADSVLNVLEEIRTGISDAFVKSIDSAILFGTDSPFDNNLVDVAEPNKVISTGSFDADISSAMGKVEDADLTVNGIVTSNKSRQILRDLRDSNGNAMVIPDGVGKESIYNTPIYIPTSRAWNHTKAQSIVGDFKKAVIGTREGITYEILDQATVGEINLAERDMIAVKCTMRFGFEVVNKKAFSKVVPSA